MFPDKTLWFKETERSNHGKTSTGRLFSRILGGLFSQLSRLWWPLESKRVLVHRFVERTDLTRDFDWHRSVRRLRGGRIRSVHHPRVGNLAARHCSRPSETQGCWVLTVVDSSELRSLCRVHRGPHLVCNGVKASSYRVLEDTPEQ